MSYDQPPTGPQRSDSSGGKVVGIVAAVIGIALIAGGVFYFVQHDDGGGKGGGRVAVPGGSKKGAGGKQPAGNRTIYQLTTPKTVGKFKMAEKPGKPRKLNAREQKQFGITDGTQVQARYHAPGVKGYVSKGATSVPFVGVSGRVANPAATVNNVFRMLKSDAGKKVGTPRRVHPAGMDSATVKCAKTFRNMTCNWADVSTYANIQVEKQVNESGKAGAPSLKETSAVLSEFYKGTRKPLSR